MGELFGTNAHLIVFLHVIAAVIWVGGMIAIRFAVHYATPSIEDPKVKIGVTLEILKRFFKIIWAAILVLIVTAVFMTLGFNFKQTDLSPIAHAKEGIWTVMTLVFIYITMKRNKAEKLFNEGNMLECKKQLLAIPGYLIPINITLGIIAIYLGIVLRGL